MNSISWPAIKSQNNVKKEKTTFLEMRPEYKQIKIDKYVVTNLCFKHLNIEEDWTINYSFVPLKHPNVAQAQGSRTKEHMVHLLEKRTYDQLMQQRYRKKIWNNHWIKAKAGRFVVSMCPRVRRFIYTGKIEVEITRLHYKLIGQTTKSLRPEIAEKILTIFTVQ